MLEEKTINWLRLALIPAIGPVRARKLLERFIQPDKILSASQKEIAAVLGNSLAEAINQQRKMIDLDKQLRLIEKYQVELITQDDPAYPENLKNIFDPPLVLFLRGKLSLSDNLSIAIVGTRMATVYGMNMARKISTQLGQYGFTIISGGARGIDTAAHQAALAINARTIAVLGCGLDVVYPRDNARMYEQIIQTGALISEFPMGIPPLRQNFPQRNRIISGLSIGVVVIEAPRKSGALITASAALQEGREVFCVPGQADSFTMKGSHQLLREGAKLVEGVNDIIEEIEPILRNRLPKRGTLEIGSKDVPRTAERMSLK
ncbi:MAG: DNA-processing protein DprA [Candidatus Omnitrophota bacterium]|jgi:DNA processing protein